MLRSISKIAATAAVFVTLGVAGTVTAAEKISPPAQDWQHAGIFGTFDRDQLQRGYQVYSEVCAACHSLRQIYFRNLEAIGFSENRVKAIAAEVEVAGEPDSDGEPTTRQGKPFDRIPGPYPNEQAARAANGGAYPPDLSLMVKARLGGADYLYALLTGYGDAPQGMQMNEGMSFNEYFPGHQIAMPAPLSEDAVEYEDGTSASVEQMAKDVTTFLAWTAEPELEERKRLGIKVLLFLLVLTAMTYALKRKIWSDLH